MPKSENSFLGGVAIAQVWMVKCPVFVQISSNLLETTNGNLLGVMRGFLVCYQVSVKYQILRSDSILANCQQVCMNCKIPGIRLLAIAIQYARVVKFQVCDQILYSEVIIRYEWIINIRYWFGNLPLDINEW